MGSAFTYQGQLKQGGQAVSGSGDSELTLWDADVGGTQLAGPCGGPVRMFRERLRPAGGGILGSESRV